MRAKPITGPDLADCSSATNSSSSRKIKNSAIMIIIEAKMRRF